MTCAAFDRSSVLVDHLAVLRQATRSGPSTAALGVLKLLGLELLLPPPPCSDILGVVLAQRVVDRQRQTVNGRLKHGRVERVGREDGLDDLVEGFVQAGSVGRENVRAKVGSFGGETLLFCAEVQERDASICRCPEARYEWQERNPNL